MTSSIIDAARQIQRKELQNEPVGNGWLQDFRQRFSEEFDEDADARTAVEATGQRRAKERRY
jgi:hypothetical protein